MPRVWIELRIFDVKRADAFEIDVDKGEVIHLLQQEVRRVVIDHAARVVADSLQEHLERGTVEYILTGMDFIAYVNAILFIDIKDRLPTACEFGKRLFNQSSGALWPRVDIWKGERPGEGHGTRQPQMVTRHRRLLHLIDGPFLTCGRLAMDRLWREGIESHVIDRVHRDKLALKVG